MKVAFHTLGCKVNIYETEALKQKFLKAGHEIVDQDQSAQVYVINTCSVTHIAEKKSRQYLRRMKKQNPNSVVVVTGCYAQVGQEALSALDEVDIILGTNEKQDMVRVVESYQGDTITRVRPYQGLNTFEELGAMPLMEEKTRAYIKIQEGCDRFCSYCIIPYSRGPVRIRQEGEILREAYALLERGYKELVIAGINTALYPDLVGLLKKIDAMEGDFRIRLSSLEPTVINKELVKELFPIQKLCHHLHLSLQSGSNGILKEMNRKYTRQDYKDILEVIKAFDPFYGISSDVIVGFPGEGTEEFKDTLSFVEDNHFCKWHIFPYSPRKGTRAATMKNQVPPPVKKERMEQLTKAANQSTHAYQKSLKGRRVSVLFEQREGADLVGYTDAYTKVYVRTSEDLFSDFVEVQIQDPEKEGVRGILKK